MSEDTVAVQVVIVIPAQAVIVVMLVAVLLTLVTGNEKSLTDKDLMKGESMSEKDANMKGGTVHLVAETTGVIVELKNKENLDHQVGKVVDHQAENLECVAAPVKCLMYHNEV